MKKFPPVFGSRWVPAVTLSWMVNLVSSQAGVIWQSPLDGNAAADIGASGIPGGTGTPAATSDKNGNAGGAVLFDGSCYFDIGRLGPLNAGSISVWLRADVITGERGGVAVGATGAGTDVYFSFMNSAGRIRGDLDDGLARRASQNNAVLTVGQWYHVVITFDSNAAGSQQLRVYQDGVLQTAPAGIGGDVAPYTMTHNGLIGSERTSERFWNGALDDVRIYDNELTQAQVTELFAGGPKFGNAGDADNDGLPDLWEAEYGLSTSDNGTGNINNGPLGDPDLDGSNNLEEYTRHTRPNNPDTDGDGLNDKVESKTGTWAGPGNTGTDPLLRDTDNDGLEDGVENNNGIFESAAKTGTDPHLADTDGDTMPDGYEVSRQLNPVSDADATQDPDEDGSPNLDEFVRGTHPRQADTDADGLKDGAETNTGIWTNAGDTGTDPLKRDTDGDRLADGVETNTGDFISSTSTGTNPLAQDSDNDGFTDQTEVVNGSDPVDTASVPAALVRTLMVGRTATAVTGADAALAGFLQDHFGLDAITYVQSAGVSAGSEAGYNLVFLSATPDSGELRSKFQASTVPVVNCEEAIADNNAGEFGFASAILTKSITVTQVALQPHPITAGLASPVTLFTGTPAEITCSNLLHAGLSPVASAVDGTISTGTGTVGSPVAGYHLIYVAETGDALEPGAGVPGNVATSRRVQLPLTDPTFNTFTPAARQLVGNALDWAVGRLAPPTGAGDFAVTALSLNGAGNQLTLTWNSEDAGGRTFDVLSSPDLSLPLASWNVAASGVAPSGGSSTSHMLFVNPGVSGRLFFVIRRN